MITCTLPSGATAEIIDAEPGRVLIHVNQGWTLWFDRWQIGEIKVNGVPVSPLRSAVDAVLVSHIHTAVDNAAKAEMERIDNGR